MPEDSSAQVALLVQPADDAASSVDAASQRGRALRHSATGRHEHYIHRSNWLRAAVLGANDGVVSVGALAIGVGGATTDMRTILLSTIAAIVAGALSMGVGEYISVSSQRDIEEADVEKERVAQGSGPAARARELDELAQIYIDRGLDPELAREVAIKLTEHDVIRAHARDELGIDIDAYTNAYAAAAASMACFVLGGIVPLAVLLIPNLTSEQRLLAIAAAITVALALFGFAGAWAGGAPVWKGVVRVLLGGWIALAISFGAGKMFGHAPVWLTEGRSSAGM